MAVRFADCSAEKTQEFNLKLIEKPFQGDLIASHIACGSIMELPRRLVHEAVIWARLDSSICTLVGRLIFRFMSRESHDFSTNHKLSPIKSEPQVERWRCRCLTVGLVNVTAKRMITETA